MKRVVFILIAVLLLLFTACSKDKEPTAPDFTNDDFYLNKDYVFDIEGWHQDGEFFQEIFITSKSKISSLVVNGESIDLDYDFEDGYYEYYTDELYGETLVALPGEKCDYSFEMEGKSYSGSVVMPLKANINFPVFDFNKDYKLSWSDSKNPSVYILDYYFWDNWDDDDVGDHVQLAGSKKEYTIPKSVWQHLDEDEIYNWIDLVSINYQEISKNLAFAILWQMDYYDYDWYKAGKRDRSKQVLDKIQKGEIELK